MNLYPPNVEGSGKTGALHLSRQEMAETLGITLIICGLLLVLVTVGFFGGHTPHSFTL